jgi:hypothetical protein
MPLQEPRRAEKTFERGGVWVSHRPVVVDAAGRIPSKGGGGVKMPKKSTSSSRLDAREVEAVAVALKSSKGPPPLARIWTQGRWW